MSFNRIGAMGVQQGLVSPEEEFMAQRRDAARRAQMALLQGGGGGGSFNGVGPGGAAATGGDPQQSEFREDQVFNRNLRGALEMEKQGGMNALDLSKQGGINQLGVADKHMAPALLREQTNRLAYDDGAGLRNMRQKVGMKTLQPYLDGAAPIGSSPEDLMQFSMAMGNDVSPHLALQGKREQWKHDDAMTQRATLDALLAKLYELNPDAAVKLIPGSSFGGSDQQAVGEAFKAARPRLENADTELGNYTTSVQKFAAKDDALTGWDPTMADVDRLDTSANNLIALIMRDKGVSEQEAREFVNRKIQESVAEHELGTGTGWIKTLKQKRGIQ